MVIVTRSLSALACLLLLPLAVLAQDGQNVQDKEKEKEKEGESKGLRFVWNRRPSLRAGDMLRVDFRVKLQEDGLSFSPKSEAPEESFVFARRRIGIQGNFLKVFEYRVERELTRESPWRDVFLNFRYFRDVQLQAGRFKVPFSLDQLTGEMDNDFIHRSRIGDLLAPGRDVGVMAHGRVLGRGLSYQGGVFRHDGDNSRFGHNPGAGRTVAGRIVVTPLRLVTKDSPLADLEAGLAMTGGDVPEGLNALRGVSIWDTRFSSDVYVKGRRLRTGVEENWEPGPFSVKSEYVRVSDERREQGLLNDDLPKLLSRGWYVSATWIVTGEKKAGGIEPSRPLFRHGAGAIEIAGRYDRIRFGSNAPGEEPETNPRAVNLAENGEGIWTAGVNWYVNHWVKIQVNSMREAFEDIDRSPRPGRARFWTHIVRFQFVL